VNPTVGRLCISPTSTLYQAMARINETAHGIVLVVDEEGRLLSTITDGDLRRAVLAGIDLTQKNVSALPRGHKPVTASACTPRQAVFQLMRDHNLRQIPLVDEEGCLQDLVHLDDFLAEEEVGQIKAVLMAGGFGTRLRPLTEDVPKPLLPLDKRPLLERTVDQLRAAGVRQVILATHYKPEAFHKHFGNGERFGVDITYMQEENPLGTAGILGALPVSAEPLLVINADIVTSLDYRAMMRFHEENHADMTVGVSQYEFSVPYGVVTMDGVDVCGIQEKPRQRFFVNAGIYLLQPGVPAFVPRDSRFDMPDLIASLLMEKKRVIAFPISEYWLDIGQMADYEKAQVDVQRACA
jgi:dTDP-glucose pyrophosphorylase